MREKPFFTFLLVGIINTIIGLSSIYICLNLLHLNYWAATFIGNAVGACTSYLLNKHFTFKSDASMLASGFRFIIIILMSYFVAYKIGLEVVEGFTGRMTFLQDYTDEIAVLFGSGFYTLLNYFGQKYYVFPKREENARAIK